MAKKKKASSDQKLKATLKQVKRDLKQSEAKHAAWKKRAKKAEKAVADLQVRLRQADDQAQKVLKKTSKSPPPLGQSDGRADARGSVATSQRDAASTDTSARPDASWTVARLQAEARRRGVTGLSGKPKAELLQALT